jgi:hypothetical protein
MTMPICEAVWLVCDVCGVWVRGGRIKNPLPNSKGFMVIVPEFAPGVNSADVEVSAILGQPPSVRCRACADRRGSLAPGEIWAPDGRGGPCGLCGADAVFEMPEFLRVRQPDGTTHVCHPASGGCAAGFARDAEGCLGCRRLQVPMDKTADSQ